MASFALDRIASCEWKGGIEEWISERASDSFEIKFFRRLKNLDISSNIAERCVGGE